MQNSVFVKMLTRQGKPQLIQEQHSATVVSTLQENRIICCCGNAFNAFGPHYVAAIQYSEHDLEKQPGMQCRMNEQHKILKEEPL